LRETEKVEGLADTKGVLPQKFNINHDTKSVCIRLALHFKLIATMPSTSVEEREFMTHEPYASAVSSLINTIVCTRSDLSQAV